MHDFLNKLLNNFGPLLLVILIGGAALLFLALLNRRRQNAGKPLRLIPGFIKAALLFATLMTAIAVSPLDSGVKGQLLSVVGIIVSATIALASSTFLGNAMAGVMLRIVKNFFMGDFIKVGEYFGRVSDRGWLHTEIQTEERQLVTLPNLFLATNPVTVIRSSGTVISAVVSLGYDVHRTDIEQALVEAALDADLKDPFVHIMELGDYSVSYRISGILEDVKQLVTARSKLRSRMLDALHRHSIEIVSPTFMNQRVFDKEQQFIPEKSAVPAKEHDVDAERIIFDKAEDAQSEEQQQYKLSQITEKIAVLQEKIKKAETDDKMAELNRKLERYTNWQQLLQQRLGLKEPESESKSETKPDPKSASQPEPKSKLESELESELDTELNKEN